MKSFNEAQMGDPWEWCKQVLERHRITSRLLADQVDAPHSTLRALYNATTANPRYKLLCTIIDLCIRLENGEMEFVKTADPVRHEIQEPVKEKVARKQPLKEIVVPPEFDFL